MQPRREINTRATLPETPRSQRTPRRKLSFAAATQQTASNLRASIPMREKQQPKTKFSNKLRGPSTGTSRLTSLRVTQAEVPPRIQQKALFVSKLDKTTTEEELLNHLRKIIPTNIPVQVTKLRSENQQFYASFHVATPAETFAEVNDSSIWPLGVQFRQYRGQLRDYTKFGNDSQTPENSPKRKIRRQNEQRNMSQ